ncbi:hypothetical protein DF186_21370, partial [Enterococcus hirae]
FFRVFSGLRSVLIRCFFFYFCLYEREETKKRRGIFYVTVKRFFIVSRRRKGIRVKKNEEFKYKGKDSRDVR